MSTRSKGGGSGSGDEAGSKHPRDSNVEDHEETIKRLKQQAELANKRAELANKRAELANKRAELANKRAKKEEEERIKEQQERIKEQQLKAGTYYTLFNELWETKAEEFKGDHMKTFQRTKLPNFVAKSNGASGTRPYLVTVRHARRPDTQVKDDGQSARTSHNSRTEKEDIWPCDVLAIDLPEKKPCAVASTGTDEDTTDIDSKNEAQEDLPSDKSGEDTQRESQSDPKKAPDAEHPQHKESAPKSTNYQGGGRLVFGEIAHLVPASPLYASLYLNVAKWVFAIKPDGKEDDNHYTIQKIIHGCKESNKNSKRLKSTGLKHFAANKIRLNGQKEYFDVQANVLIIPILSLEQVLDWNGNGYNALFLVGDRAPDKMLAKRTVGSVGMQEEGPIAEDNEIETSRELLKMAVLSLAQSLQELHEEKPTVFTPKHTDKIKELYDQFKVCMEAKFKKHQEMVLVPESRENLKDVKVRKITFMDQSDHGHPAPDPLLLVVKAAINWSKFYGFQLLAAGEPEEDEDELSLLAEQEFLEMRDALRREQMEKEIIGMSVGPGLMS